jgi:hypothetical protein
MAGLLKTTLTPMGSERAGNADGSIPAWTGGLTQAPAGWTPDQRMPDLFASDPKILTINATNMAQYKDRLTDGVMEMMSRFPDFRIDVYPTHRTAALPQWVYDNIYQNALNTQPAQGGSRLGFSGAYGGYPFPIPDPNDPLEAGAQVMWNHSCRWQGSQFTYQPTTYSMANGVLTLLVKFNPLSYTFDFYQKNGNAANYSGWLNRGYYFGAAPPSSAGEEIIVYQPTDPLVNPQRGWELLNGQGRVRQLPELQYDVPNSQVQGITNYDESYLFYGALDRYDWRLLGKKEMYIPYNNNKAYPMSAADYGPNFMNPDLIRYELHRVWVVDATVHPGDRNVIAHRRYYFDEDTWTAVLTDSWDAQGNFWKTGLAFNINRPDVPGTIFWDACIYNLQSAEYAHAYAFDITQPDQYGVIDFTTIPSESLFNVQNMAARGQY